MGFPVQVGDRIAELILEKIETPAIEKFIVLGGTERGSGGFGSMGLQPSDPSTSVKQKEDWAEKREKVQKERILEGSKERLLQAPILCLGKENPSLVLKKRVEPCGKLQTRILRR